MASGWGLTTVLDPRPDFFDGIGQWKGAIFNGLYLGFDFIYVLCTKAGQGCGFTPSLVRVLGHGHQQSIPLREGAQCGLKGFVKWQRKPVNLDHSQVPTHNKSPNTSSKRAAPARCTLRSGPSFLYTLRIS